MDIDAVDDNQPFDDGEPAGGHKKNSPKETGRSATRRFGPHGEERGDMRDDPRKEAPKKEAARLLKRSKRQILQRHGIPKKEIDAGSSHETKLARLKKVRQKLGMKRRDQLRMMDSDLEQLNTARESVDTSQPSGKLHDELLKQQFWLLHSWYAALNNEMKKKGRNAAKELNASLADIAARFSGRTITPEEALKMRRQQIAVKKREKGSVGSSSSKRRKV